MDYADLKLLAKQRKCSVKELIVLAPQNDPFYTGTPADIRTAEWFAALWTRFGFNTGVHLRRIHYVLVSQKTYLTANGKAYENTESCWQDLNAASKTARCLKLVPASAFVDRRNPPAQEFFNFYVEPRTPHLELPDEDDWQLPSIAPALDFSLEFPNPAVCGYGYEPACQPYMLEIWCEKSTQNDVLIPACKAHGANLVTGLGNLSITHVLGLIERVKQAGKPCRVFYVSDFDPAGVWMPSAVSRQVEFWLDEYGPGLDIALEAIALTRDQIDHYQLPRVPIKDTDKRAGSFEAQHGEGACELDALEALHPGSLREIVETAIAPFIDADLRKKLQAAREESQEWLETAWPDATVDQWLKFEQIKREVVTIAESFRERLEAMSKELEAEISPLRSELESLWQGISATAEELESDLEPRPDPEVSPDDQDWLFKSERDYLEQLAYYKAKTGSGKAA